MKIVKLDVLSLHLTAKSRDCEAVAAPKVIVLLLLFLVVL